MMDDPQTVAALSQREFQILLGAMGAMWGTLVLVTAAAWRLGAAWVAKINARVEAFPQMIRDALDEHEKKDVVRHEQQMTAIRKNADAYTAPWAAMQEAQATLKDRVAAVEDTDRSVPLKPRRKR